MCRLTLTGLMNNHGTYCFRLALPFHPGRTGESRCDIRAGKSVPGADGACREALPQRLCKAHCPVREPLDIRKAKKSVQPECEALAEIARRYGVPPSAILRECTARHTLDNARLSKQALDDAGITIRSASCVARISMHGAA